MPVYWDDWNGVRKQVTPKYLDNPLGVRRTLSGGYNLGTGTVGPVNPNPPSGGGSSLPLMFLWPGVVTQAQAEATLGQSPQGWCKYVQRPQLSTMVRDLSPDVRAGFHLHVGCGAANDKTAYPNGSLELMKGLGDRTAFAVDFWSQFCVNANTVALVNPNVTVKISPTVEPETGYMQGSHDSTSTFYGEPVAGTPTPTPAQRAQTLAAIGRFYSVFYEIAADLAPRCIKTLWIGGTGLRNAERNRMFDAIPDNRGPQEILTDPYNNNTDLTERPIDTWRPFVNAWRVSSGAHFSHWVRWGQPPVGLGETGIDRLAYTDAQMVPWVERIYEDAVELDLTQVNYFNSSGPNGNQAIINSSYPRASAALSGEITEAKNALAAAA